MHLLIRPYRQTDQHALLQLWLEATVKGQSFIPEPYWQHMLPEVRDHFLPSAEVWIAEGGGKILGFAALQGELLSGLYVLPAAQGRQIGSRLMAHVRSLHQGPLFVEVYEKNRMALSFYLRHGFTFLEKRIDTGTGEVMDCLELKPEILLKFSGNA